ncbi:MAG: LamG-like jellyroll fold domain-containing protein [Candidatus Hodarchaeota archaeon]
MKTRMKSAILGAMLVIMLTTGFGYADLSDGLIAYYPFNGNANDESGNENNGIVMGATLTADRFGNADRAYYFEGWTYSNDEIRLSSEIPATTGDGSWSVWVNPDPSIHIGCVLGKNNLIVGYVICLYPDRFWVGAGTSTTQVNWPFDTLGMAEEWHHLLLRKSGSTLTLYVNGVSQGNRTMSRISPIASIGVGESYGQYFGGSIDEVRIYNRALSESEIAELAGIDLTSGLVGYWSFDDPGNLGCDYSGTGNHGSPVGGATPTSGVMGGAVHLNGSSYINVPDSPSLDLPGEARGTISAFIKVDPSSDQCGIVVKESSSSFPSTIAYEFTLRSDHMSMLVSDGSYTGWGSHYPASLADSAWHHVAATWVPDDIRLYIDGVLVFQGNLGNPIYAINNISDPVLIGAFRWNVWGQYRCMTGDMDEVRIYNRALSESEIGQLAGTAPPTPAEQIQEILDFVYESVASGTLVGVGPGKSAENRLVAVMNMLEEAWVLIEAEWFAQACHQLRDVLKKCDGQSPPEDLVSGPAAEELAGRINDLMDEICEDTMFAPAEVMTWVPPYVAQQCLKVVEEDFTSGCGPKDGLTRVGLQFWVPRADGTIKYADHERYTPTDADVDSWRSWCSSNGIKCLLCIYNNIGSWDWNLARSAFADTNNRARFVSALVSKMDNLDLDGIDVDLEGLDPAILASDRSAFDQFIHDLSVQVRALGKILTVDTFSLTANAPNINWWIDWVGDVDNIHSMGYDDLYEGGTDFQKYSNQQAIGYLSGYDRDVVLMGMPAWLSSWGTSSGRGTSALAHVQEVHYDLPEPTGIAIWSLQHLLPSEAPPESPWRDSALWCEIKELKGDD